MKKFGLIIGVMAMLAIAVGIVGAQDEASQRLPRAFANTLRAVVRIVSEETGLTPQEIRAQVEQGMTLSDIITSHGGDPAAVIDEAVASITERVNQALEEDRISEEMAARILENLQEVVTNIVNGEFEGRPVRRMIARGLVRAVAEATGLTVEEVRSQVEDGSTLADILTAKGVDVQGFIDDVIARADERLSQAVENGRITEEQKANRLAALSEKLPTWLNTLPGSEQ